MNKSLIAVAIGAALALPAVSEAVTFVDLNLSAFHKPDSTTTVTSNSCSVLAAVTNDSFQECSTTTNAVTNGDRDARNIGLGLEFQTQSRAATALVGFNLGNWNEYAAAEFAPINVGSRDHNFSAGLIGAVAHTDNIGNYPTGGIFLSVNRNKFGANLIATPTVNNVPAFVGLQLRYRLGDDPKPTPVALVIAPAVIPAPVPAPAPAPIVTPPAPPPAPIVEEVVVKRGRE